MNSQIFRNIMRDIDNCSDGIAVACDFLVSTGGKVTGTWEWLPHDGAAIDMLDVIIVSWPDHPPAYIPVSEIVAVQVVRK